MKTPVQIRKMQSDLVTAMTGLRLSGAPPEVLNQTAIALASADDTLNWVLELDSRLGDLEKLENERTESASGPLGAEQQNPS